MYLSTSPTINRHDQWQTSVTVAMDSYLSTSFVILAAMCTPDSNVGNLVFDLGSSVLDRHSVTAL